MNNFKLMKDRLTLVAFSICIILSIGEAQTCGPSNYLMENKCKPCGSDCRVCLPGEGCMVCSYINGECYN
jgi:hypothetical protein